MLLVAGTSKTLQNMPKDPALLQSMKSTEAEMCKTPV